MHIADPAVHRLFIGCTVHLHPVHRFLQQVHLVHLVHAARGPMLDRTVPQPPSASETEMVQVVLPNDANPLGFILGGTVMHLMDIAAAVAAYRHTRELVVTAEVDGLQFLHPIKVGDLIVLKARVTATFRTSLEVEVHVYSEETLTGERRLTSHAYLTFATVPRDGCRVPVRPLLLETEEDTRIAAEAGKRREERLKRRSMQ